MIILILYVRLALLLVFSIAGSCCLAFVCVGDVSLVIVCLRLFGCSVLVGPSKDHNSERTRK